MNTKSHKSIHLLPKLTHRFNAVPVDNLTGYREEHDKLILKFKTKGQKVSKQLLNSHLKGDAISQQIAKLLRGNRK